MKHLKPIYIMTLTLAFACSGKDSSQKNPTQTVKNPEVKSEADPSLANEPTTPTPDVNAEFCQSLQDQSITTPSPENSIRITITKNEENQTITCNKTKLKD